jgi:hypothetical protein
MRRPAAVLLALAAVAPATLTAAGCGADDVDPRTAVAEAAQATQRAESARLTIRTTVSGIGSPIPLTVTGRGVTATREAKLDVTFDFGPLLALAGAGGDGRTRLLVPGGDVFVDPPALPGLSVPGGRRWVGVDLREVTEAAGLDAGALEAFARIDPASQLAALKAAGSIERVGEADVAGTPTTHYRGRVRLSDYVRGLPADRRADAQEAIRDLERLTGEADAPMPVELWVDDESLVRRMTSRSEVPAQDGRRGGSVELTMELSDFGTRVVADPPPAREVYDATERAGGLLEQARDQGLLGGGTPPAP